MLQAAAGKAALGTTAFVGNVVHAYRLAACRPRQNLEHLYLMHELAKWKEGGVVSRRDHEAM